MGYVKAQAEREAARGYGSMEKAVCPRHVDDAVLKKLIGDYATEMSCNYCDASPTDEEPIAAAFEDFMELFMVGVHHQYARADDEGVIYDEGEYVGATVYTSEDIAQETLYAALNDYPDAAQDELLTDIADVMHPENWVRLNWLWPSIEDRLANSWDGFKELVKHRTRFLFARLPIRHHHESDEMSPLEFFESLLALLSGLPEVTLDVDTPLYRGRMFLEAPDLKKIGARELGPAPLTKAAANRMSPAGISMFYGARDIETTVAEIGAHSSYSWAVVGEFRAIESLRVIDLSDPPPLPSIFESKESSMRRYNEIAFLRSFVKDLTLPIVLDGREHIDYVPTQVFTEYLRYTFPTSLDGLVFPSAQGPGKNILLFCGPGSCSDPGDVGPETELVLSDGSVEKYSVTTVIRPH